MKEITGQVHVTMRNAECYGGRRIHVRIDGLPGWLLSILSESGPFKLEATTYNQHDDAPYSLLLGSTRVVSTTEPAPYQVPKGEPAANEGNDTKGTTT